METPGQINFEWLLMEDQLQRSLEVPMPWMPINLPTNPLHEYTSTSMISQGNNNLTFTTQGLENIEADFHLWNEMPSLCEDAWKPLTQVLPTNINNNVPCMFDNNPKPINIFDQNYDQFPLLDNYFINSIDSTTDQALIVTDAEGFNMNPKQGNMTSDCLTEVKSSKTPKTESIQYEEIMKYFDMPICEAAKKLNVGLTVLKKRCRELNIKRWPHRKIRSLEALIYNVKEMGMMDVARELEEHKRKLKVLPWLELDEGIKKLRQACFKANYKKRRALALTQF